MALNSNALTTVADLRTFLADSFTAAETGRMATSALESIINQASSYIERWCNRTLIAPSAAVTYNLPGYGERTIWLPDYPIISVTSITFNESVLTVPASSGVDVAGWYLTDEGSLMGRIDLDGYGTDRGPRGVTVVARCGYNATVAATTPATAVSRDHATALDTLKRACHTVCGSWYENRLGHSSQTVSGQSVSFDSGTLPPRAEELLRTFRRVVVA